MPVDYAPSDVGADMGMLEIGSDDPNEAVVTVSIAGTGAQTPICDIAVTPATLDFGPVEIGSMLMRSATVSNTGTGACSIDSIQVTGTDLTLGTGAPSVPLTLQPNDSVTVPVDYMPSDEGADSGTLAVSSDDGPVTVALQQGAGYNLTVVPGVGGVSVDTGDVLYEDSATTTLMVNGGGPAVTVSSRSGGITVVDAP